MLMKKKRIKKRFIKLKTSVRKKHTPYKYTYKQMTHYKRQSKTDKLITKWTKMIELLETRIERALSKENISDTRRKLLERFIKKQGIEERIQSRLQKIQETKRIQQQNMRKLIKNAIPLANYLKKEHIATIKTNFQRLNGNTKKTYSDLLDSAMINPEKFKETLIQQMDKLKHLLEIKITFISNYRGQLKEQATIICNNNTLEEVLLKLKEAGIRINEILDSAKFNDFKLRLGGNTPSTFIQPDKGLTNIAFNISLRRGKI